jgi:two-component sensor histidine kinase
MLLEDGELPNDGGPDPQANRAFTERLLAFDALLENMTEGFAMCEAIWDAQHHLADYTILELNPALQRMLGVGPEAVGTKLSAGAAYRTDWLRLCDHVLKTGEPASFELQTPGVDRWHEIRITRVTEERLAQLFFDISERKNAERRQAELFDELNHRVNNNLMLVSGILHMKARETNHDVVRDQLLRAEARVQSIAQVHKALYRGPRNDVVDFGAYLNELCVGIKDALIHDGRIGIEIEAESVSTNVDTAIALGMVVNELVTNAVKYAYPLPKKGQIWVRFAREGSNLLLSVRDTGIGFQDDAGSRHGGGLGVKLVKSLVAQVHGELVRLGPQGTTVQITMGVAAS